MYSIDRNSRSSIAHSFYRARCATAAGVLVCAGLGVAVSQVSAPETPGTTPAGYAVNFSQYVAAHDGTKIAIDVWLPKGLIRGEHIPALIKGTPYWRAGALTFLGKALSELGEFPGNLLCDLCVCAIRAKDGVVVKQRVENLKRRKRAGLRDLIANQVVQCELVNALGCRSKVGVDLETFEIANDQQRWIAEFFAIIVQLFVCLF